MKFLDEIKIFVKSGSGGSGCCSFRREKFIEYGGPDGGNGGKGGDVIIKCTNSLNTLIDYKYKQHCIAKDGKPGMKKNKTGRNGSDFTINVPLGTEILMDDKKTLIKDLSKENDQIIIAFGGNGGLGNINYKSSTNRSPRKFSKGENGEEKWLYLKLKLIADIGIIGLPNVGKSSFIKKISAAKPKIGDYPFTTITPNLANILINNKEFTFADIPGVIEDAHKGKGLGLDFLSHIERCKILLHLIDVTDNKIIKNYRIIRNEIKKYKNKVEKKNELICLTKCDLLNKNELKYKIIELKNGCKKEIYYCSNVTGEGIKKVLQKLENLYEKKN
jgi:GTP-binding protein